MCLCSLPIPKGKKRGKNGLRWWCLFCFSFIFSGHPDSKCLVSSVGNLHSQLSFIPFPMCFILPPRPFIRFSALSQTDAYWGALMSFKLNLVYNSFGSFLGIVQPFRSWWLSLLNDVGCCFFVLRHSTG